MAAIVAIAIGATEASAGGASAAVPAAPAVAVSSAAVSADAGAGEGACRSCEPWVQDQLKKALLELVSAFYATSLDTAKGGSEQSELVSTMAARLVAYEK